MEEIQDDWWPRTDCPGKSNTARNDLNKVLSKMNIVILTLQNISLPKLYKVCLE